jgi:hypothetical protein
MGNNNRIFYGSQIAQLKPATSGIKFGFWYQPQGLQSVGYNTSVSTEQAFQLGAIDIYSISENVPEVEVTLNKVVDGSCPLYLMAMGGKSGIAGANVTNFDDPEELKLKGFGGLAYNTVDFRLGIYKDTNSTVEGNTTDYILCTPTYLSSLNYTFPVDGNATEAITLVGNTKYLKANGSAEVSATMTAATIDKTAKKLARRHYIDVNNSILPTGYGGAWKSGGLPTGVDVNLYLQNITISANLGRDQINELGQLAPYYRYATFPVEVTTEFEIIGQVGDYVSANDFLFSSGCAVNYQNLNDFPIKLKICGSGVGNEANNYDYSVSANNYLEFYLGSGNKLTSVSYAGGDTGGGNVTITYGFRNYNDFYMKAAGNYNGVAIVS